MADNSTQLTQALASLDRHDVSYATRFAEGLLSGAVAAGASDVHLQPTADGLAVQWRLDGVLQPLGTFPRGDATDIVTRLKVLAELLTYRSDVPQEGRIRSPIAGRELRVSTFPTLHGERAVIRIAQSGAGLLRLEQLALPDEVATRLGNLLRETSGAVIIAGPAGSGKTTTVYACLRELVAQAAPVRSIVSIEDPIEVALDGVAQSQVNAAAGFDLATGLRSVLRQDPEVLMVGEIRDRAVAEGVFSAALTGHLVLTTFHASSAAGAISRLGEMNIEPYLLRSGLLGVVGQRLLRRLCSCARWSTDVDDRLGLPLDRVPVAVGCEQCRHTGYLGRLAIAELLVAEATELGRAILSRSDAAQLEELARQNGLVPLRDQALAAIRAGRTSPVEYRRVLGWDCRVDREGCDQ